jgi:hypothetical protein
MYVEMSAPVIDAENREKFRKVVEKRAAELEESRQRNGCEGSQEARVDPEIVHFKCAAPSH